MIEELVLSEGGWFEGLPYSQRQLLEGMLETAANEEEVAEIWLARPGSSMNAAFGGDPAAQGASFFANVKIEFLAFMCGSSKYKEDQRQAADILEQGWKDWPRFSRRNRHCPAGRLCGRRYNSGSCIIAFAGKQDDASRFLRDQRLPLRNTRALIAQCGP
ncbi:hypothetical protein QP185_18205 [Sphingomonas aerolata]|uniref:hypothetical protein n=1 Tax=Sphingomonas aerolata TaxID=185951 RepID=UPI002FE2FAD2